MMDEGPTTQPYKGWVICALFGHSRYIGYVEEVDIFGSKMARLTTPAHGEHKAQVRYVSAASLFEVVETTEEAVRAELEEHARYLVPRPKLLGQTVQVDEYTEGDTWNDDTEDQRDGQAEGHMSGGEEP